MLANNIANASTGGYKADREFYSIFVSPEAEGPAPVMPLVERPWVDLSQGTLQPTGSPLDLALSGRGFFAVDGPGETLYTRNGSFHLSPSGNLVTAEGYAVRGEGGGGLTLDPARSMDVLPDGTVEQAGALAGKVSVVEFGDAGALVKRAGNYFRAGSAAGAGPAQETVVKQGHLEASNTSPAEGAVRLVSVMRQFEMLQKAAGLAGDMGRQAVEVVARVGS